MRKAHYMILADILKRHFQSAHKASHYTDETREILMAKIDSIADCFARECKLDRESFLIASGVLRR